LRRAVPCLAFFLLAAAGLAQLPAAGTAKLLFRDVAAGAGVTVQHNAAPEKQYIMESMSSGLALLDYDNDGLLDIYLTDAPTVATVGNPKAARSVLYRNLGNGKFQDVTDRAGVAHPTWPMGVCTADVDGDGWQDIYVTGFARNTYYHNNGDGTFTDIADQAGVAGGRWSMGCGFADYDRDGDLDLFVSRYVWVKLEALPVFGKGGAEMKGEGRGASCQWRGISVQCGPRGLPGESDLLFRNDGNGRFTEVSEQAGVHDPRKSFGLGIAWFDYNADGWPDLYVANDSHPN
jgi:enediyne biosynthesis protein E4